MNAMLFSRGHRSIPSSTGTVPVTANLVAQWIGDTATTTSWSDSSGNSKTATGVGTVVTSVLNGHSVVGFNGTTNIFTSSSVTLGAWTVFCVFKSTASGEAIVFEISNNTNTNQGGFLATSIISTISATSSAGASNSAWNLTSNWANDSTWRYCTVVNDGTHAGHVLYINGILQTLSSGLSGASGTASFSAPVNIGARNGLVIPMTGQIAELLIYSSALNSTDRGSVESYLKTKYGL